MASYELVHELHQRPSLLGLRGVIPEFGVESKAQGAFSVDKDLIQGLPCIFHVERYPVVQSKPSRSICGGNLL